MPNARKCKHCGEYGKDHIKINMSSFCGHQCAVKYSLEQSAKKREKEAQRQRKKAQRQKIDFRNETQRRRKDLATIGTWHKGLQDLINAVVVKVIDKDKPCYTCGTYTADSYHAGHFKHAGGTGARSDIRFNLYNIRKQCNQCNTYGGGRPTEYQANLISEHGQWLVDDLEQRRPDLKEQYPSREDIELEMKHWRKVLKDNGIKPPGFRLK